ncbi:MAG: response regulator transcription factor [Crocinitomicaceae bacterium]|nr:response regulator transcription factor [Crocinitomicaceae bacterium]
MKETIEKSLLKEKYTVESALDFDAASEKIELYEYDCILLDINLPEGTGLELLDQLKQLDKNQNVIIISARDSLDDKVKGLELGADDYLTKPFHVAELTARIKAVVRRKQVNGKFDFQIGNVILNIEERRCSINNVNIHLNRKEFDILYYFVLNENRLITRTSLADHVWGDNIDQADNFDFIYYQIKNLRKQKKRLNCST